MSLIEPYDKFRHEIYRKNTLLKSKIQFSSKCLTGGKKPRSKSMLHSKLIFQTPSRWRSNMPIKAHMEEGKLNEGE